MSLVELTDWYVLSCQSYCACRTSTPRSRIRKHGAQQSESRQPHSKFYRPRTLASARVSWVKGFTVPLLALRGCFESLQVDVDGDEMTRVIWKDIKEKVRNPLSLGSYNCSKPCPIYSLAAILGNDEDLNISQKRSPCAAHLPLLGPQDRVLWPWSAKSGCHLWSSHSRCCACNPGQD